MGNCGLAHVALFIEFILSLEIIYITKDSKFCFHVPEEKEF